MLTLFVLLTGCSALTGALHSNATAPDLNGVWAVTMKYSEGSCPDVTGGSQSSMWTVNQDAQGAYLVNVQGGDKMTTLWGKVDGKDVTLTGLVDDYPSAMTAWRLSGGGSSVSGRAIQTKTAKITRPKAAEPQGSRVISLFGNTGNGDTEKTAMCSVIWTVEATKQGK